VTGVVNFPISLWDRWTRIGFVSRVDRDESVHQSLELNDNTLLADLMNARLEIP